ncbi:zonular occludens toxin domain-containing protein [Vibrio nigripulchritudo]|uniref:zonular occludens toxin domain-containing protein n=1 Tax=Vibrio nigripulchritudo TaxID=28173 RepID=UPI002490FB51|nr:zonular occludens toxin domain-containing protein [Vibrio nigripulchritudo]BDU45856.1 hypothetical protein TUMSATVNIG3_46540 [Vibrio nigripulchritudo]
MLHGFSGSPGTGKSLNAIKFIIENEHFANRPVYYHGIRVLLLDYDACDSFQGWLYGVHYPANEDNTALKNKLKRIDKEHRLATLDDFPYLAYEYKQHDPVALWLAWFKKVASKQRLDLLNESLEVLGISEDELTGERIKEMGLSWTQFHDPTLIHELPSGSVILCDEVQNIWGTRQSSKTPPPDVEFVATHRHNGQDLVYISQDFRDVDQFIRRRIAHYTHFEFLGGDWLERYHNNNLFDPSSKADLRKVGSNKVLRDKKFYGLYLSSIDHTQKVGLSASMKKALKMGAFALLLLIGGIVGVFQTPLFANVLFDPEPEETTLEGGETSTQTTQGGTAYTQPIETYISKYVPRHTAVPWSAPVYDSATREAQSYPRLTCVKTTSNCECFTQQMTSYDIDAMYCEVIAENGFFDPFQPNADGRKLKKSNTQDKKATPENVKGIF